MARSQYQYQALTGPIWVASVAASLAWLPCGQAPGRALPPTRVGDYVPPFSEAVAVARNLAWQPSGNVVVRALPPNRLGAVDEPFVDAVAIASDLHWAGQTVRPSLPERRLRDGTILAPFQPGAPAFDPALLHWLAYLPRINRSLDVGRLGAFVLDPFPRPPSFDPATFPWVAVLGPPVRRELRPTADWSVDVAGIYDPSALDWLVVPARQFLTAPRGVQTWSLLSPLPPADAFNAGQLQWLPYLPVPPRRLETGRLGAFVLDSIPRPPGAFDPALLPPSQAVIWRALQQILRGELVEPITAALYRPAGLQWLPTGRSPLVAVAPHRLGWIVGDPLPHPILVLPYGLRIGDLSGAQFRLLELSGQFYIIGDSSHIATALDDESAE